MLHRLYLLSLLSFVSKFLHHLEEDFRNKVKKKAGDLWKSFKPPEQELSVGVTAGRQVGNQERQREKEWHKMQFLYVPGHGFLALLHENWGQITSNRAQRGRQGRQVSWDAVSAAGETDLRNGSVDTRGREVVQGFPQKLSCHLDLNVIFHDHALRERGKNIFYVSQTSGNDWPAEI